MKIIKDFPPNYVEICKVFDITDIKTLVFTYGDTIYAPGKTRAIPKDLKIHEKTHQKQQGNDPAGWWKKYLTDKKFRLDQEVEAYGNQYRFFIGRNHNLKEQSSFLEKIVSDLSSRIYGNIVTKLEAEKLIKYGK